jgi:hypothetical protein
VPVLLDWHAIRGKDAQLLVELFRVEHHDSVYEPIRRPGRLNRKGRLNYLNVIESSLGTTYQLPNVVRA